MTKTILITGATDGIGCETALSLAADGHRLIVHGRNAAKMEALQADMSRAGHTVAAVLADMSDLGQVSDMARKVAAEQGEIDVIINNAGILRTQHEITDDGLDIRFVVNTYAPALLSLLLLPKMASDGRLVHLSSAAQAPVDLKAMAGERRLGAMDAYAQSKLALTMWSQDFAARHADGPMSVAVNPGSLLATKMVREGFGTAGSDINIGVDILRRAALSEEFASASGRYFDNDSGQFAPPHPEAADAGKVAKVVAAIEAQIAAYLA